MSGTRSAYAPRDVINAPAIKAAIQRRSRQRGDTPEVSAWLLNHFYRHVVGNLAGAAPDVQQVTSAGQARELFAPGVVPDWVGRRLKQPAAPTMWWLNTDSELLLGLEQRLVEFLGSRHGTPLQGKLMRINCPQALTLSSAEHAAFEAQALSGWREHQPTAVRTIWQGKHGIFVEMLADSAQLRAEMAYESQMMRHCLGQFADRHLCTGGYGEHYASACETGRLRLFSYRTGQQHPHITLSAVVQEDGRLAVDQIKGKQNRHPIPYYRDEVLDFLNSLPTNDSTPADAAGMGIARARSGWAPVTEIREADDQLALVKRHPYLVRELPYPTPIVQWLVAAQNPSLLHGLALAPSVTQALAAHT